MTQTQSDFTVIDETLDRISTSRSELYRTLSLTRDQINAFLYDPDRSDETVKAALIAFNPYFKCFSAFVQNTKDRHAKRLTLRKEAENDDEDAFILRSDRLLITDPCYKRGARYQAERTVKRGIWHAVAQKTNDLSGILRIKTLIAYTGTPPCDDDDWVRDPDAALCVDSGQLGVFNAKTYPGGKRHTKAGEAWYKAVCDATNRNGFASGSTVLSGFVCASGLGDGMYPLDLYNVHDVITAIRVPFMGEYDD